MFDDLLTRLARISSEALPGKSRVEARGEGYYIFEATTADGTRIVLPPVWIDPAVSDRQIHDKLCRVYEQALHPETIPDDASIPDLKTEGND